MAAAHRLHGCGPIPSDSNKHIAAHGRRPHARAPVALVPIERQKNNRWRPSGCGISHRRSSQTERGNTWPGNERKCDAADDDGEDNNNVVHQSVSTEPGHLHRLAVSSPWWQHRHHSAAGRALGGRKQKTQGDGQAAGQRGRLRRRLLTLPTTFDSPNDEGLDRTVV